jgi:hypothetical protein
MPAAFAGYIPASASSMTRHSDARIGKARLQRGDFRKNKQIVYSPPKVETML